jgi:REP-associated tyrosine transposase
MGRPPRIQSTGMTFHVTSRAVRREALFHDRLDFANLLELVDHAVAKYAWTCLAYCVMPNHFHLLVRLGDANLSTGMHLINQRYACRFNRRYDHKGHVFDDRFGAKPVLDDAHLLETIRYVPLNPVRAGLCGDPAGWEWSSFRATAGLACAPAFLATKEARVYFSGPSAREQQRRYADFVRDRAPAPPNAT